MANLARSFWPPRPPLLLLGGVIALAVVVMARSASVSGAAFSAQIVGSLFCAVAALGFFAALCYRAKGVAVAAILCMLSSRAFVDEATSGLGNPLAYLLVSAWLYVYTKGPSPGDSSVRRDAILVGLGALLFVNRVDLFLLVAPAIGVQIFGLLAQPARVWLPTLLLGMAPALAWIGFATFFYGTSPANAAWAEQQAAGSDLVTPLLIVMALVGTPLFCFVRSSWRLAPVAAGVALSLIYVVAIGGDFMMGRFLAVPFFLSVMLLTLLDESSWKKWRRLGSAATVAACLGLSLLEPLSPWRVLLP